MTDRYSTRYSLRATSVRKAYHGDTPGAKWRAVKLKGGLLSMQHTPEYLIDCVRDNSVSSPLMRLPAEIRLKIWDYAIGGMRIYLNGWTRAQYSIDGAKDIHDFDLDRQLALPRVCRQIYVETGANFYRFNVFCFLDEWALLHFRRDRKRAQCEALRTISVPVKLVILFLLASNEYWTSWRSFGEMFSGLETVIVYGGATQDESGMALDIVRRKESVGNIVLE